MQQPPARSWMDLKAYLLTKLVRKLNLKVVDPPLQRLSPPAARDPARGRAPARRGKPVTQPHGTGDDRRDGRRRRPRLRRDRGKTPSWRSGWKGGNGF